MKKIKMPLLKDKLFINFMAASKMEDQWLAVGFNPVWVIVIDTYLIAPTHNLLS